MNRPLSQSTAHRQRGFTLAELVSVLVLVVVAIIFIGIVWPFGPSAHRNERLIRSRIELTSIADACESYYLTYGAYPGYFSEEELSSMSDSFTGTENLVLSLMGGVVPGSTPGWSPDGAPQRFIDGFNISFDQIGDGPDRPDGKRYGPFYSPTDRELVPIKGTTNFDNDMPELIDHCSGLPILYMRASRNATTPKPPVTDGTTGVFNRLTIADYVEAKSLQSTRGKAFDQMSQSAFSSYNPAGNAVDNLAWWAINRKLSKVTPGDPTSANNNDDVTRGAAVLFAPGIDGIYANLAARHGKAIDEFKSVDESDDVMVFIGN
ncbi:MAG: hypothetical protein GC159_05960 [Phycisphaera sp.]|nr:hypothetical protein [Phycisphaera sp.]